MNPFCWFNWIVITPLLLLVILCFNIYFFENPGGSKMPVFEPPVRIDRGEFNVQVSYVDGEARVLLHTEIMREHLMVQRRGDRWHFSGLFDFEPAMPGGSLYEFASVGLFVSGGDGPLLRRILRASGCRADDLDESMPCRLMAQALLHRYSNLRWYLERLPLPGAVKLEQLAHHWFAIDGKGKG